MLYYSKAVVAKIAEINRRAKKEKLDPLELAESLLAVDPNWDTGILLKGMVLGLAGDLEKAEEVLWKGIAQYPCLSEMYLALSEQIHHRRPDDPVALRLKEIALWQLSLAGNIRPEVAEAWHPAVKRFGAADDPETYFMVASLAEIARKKTPDPAELDARFLPYEVLNHLQRQAHGVVSYETLRKVIGHPAEYVPLLHAAVRECANEDPEYGTLGLPGLRIFVAILGEIGGPELIGDLLELSLHPDEATALHVAWAICRLGQRYPAAALEILRAATPGASPALRCALAEQLNLLPEMEGVVPALAALVDDFPKIAKDDEAAYLLAIVTDTMAGLDAVDQAHSILSRCQPLLRKDDQAWVEETVNGDDDFIARLVEEAIDELTIEEVCLERILMGGEDGEGDEVPDDEDGGISNDAFDQFDEDEFEEDQFGEEISAPQPVFTPRTGRNDPCWCGSGKKYKKCHLRDDEQAYRGGATPVPSPTGSSHEALMLRVVRGMTRWHSKADAARAKEMYFGTSEDLETHKDETGGLVQFLLHDYRDAATGRTLIEHYLEDPASKLTAGERRTLESLRDARNGLYEIYRIEKGIGVHMRDVFSGDSFFVEDITSSREVVQWDCALLSLQFLDGRYLLAGDGTSVARRFLDQMKQFVKEESQAAGQSEVEFVRGNTYRLRLHLLDLHARGLKDLKIVNREGDLLEFGAASYEVLDRPALLTKLRSLEELIEEDGKDSTARFAWLEAGELPRSVYGHIEVSDQRLRLEASSRTRLKLGRGLLEFNAGPLLKHVGDSFESVEGLKRKAMSGEGSERARPLPSPLPSEGEREAILAIKASHYATWPEEKLPALRGKTPRQAVKTKEGREAVLNLIRTMENGEARQAKAGQPAFDFTILRRALGLDQD